MADKKGAGLLLLYADVPAEMEDDFNRWYNEEHLEERLSVPGFLSAARYEAVSGSPKYLACYELESPEVMQSEAYFKQRDNPTEWSKRISLSTRSTTFIRNIYRQIHPGAVAPGVAGSGMAPILQIGRMSTTPEHEDEWNNWYNTVYVPGYEKVPGCIRGRRYLAVDGDPKYSVVYELENDQVSSGPEWIKARESDPSSARIRTYMTHVVGSPGIYRKIFEF